MLWKEYWTRVVAIRASTAWLYDCGADVLDDPVVVDSGAEQAVTHNAASAGTLVDQ